MIFPDRLPDYFIPQPRFSNKLPKIYLDSEHDPEYPTDLCVYFVNNSIATLESVKIVHPLIYKGVGSPGYLGEDRVYPDVVPGESVKVAEFEEVFDSDFLHKIHVIWKEKGSAQEEACIFGKGLSKFRYRVLEWLSDEK